MDVTGFSMFGLLALCELDDGGEDLRVFGCQLGQHLAVELDVFGFEQWDQSGVGQAIGPAAGVDSDLPEAAEVAFLGAAVLVRCPAGMGNRHLSQFNRGFATPTVAFGVLEDVLDVFFMDDAAFDAHGG